MLIDNLWCMQASAFCFIILIQLLRDKQDARSLSGEKFFDLITFTIKRNIMKFESLREYLLNKGGGCEDFPFGPTVIVFKVMDKMFALIPLDKKLLRINLKCDPELALHLRAKYNAVQPGYHMNKKHWNTIILDGSIPDDELSAMIDDSYDLVIKGLKKGDLPHGSI